MTTLEELAGGALLYACDDRGRIRVTGEDRVAFLHNMTTADIKGLPVGHGASGVIINQRAGILDLVEVYADSDAHWIITGPGKVEADMAWLDRYLISEDVQLENASQRTVLRLLTGGQAERLLTDLAPAAEALTNGGHIEIGHPRAWVHVFKTVGLAGAGYYLMADEPAINSLEAALLRHPNAAARRIETPEFELLRIAEGLPGTAHELVDTRNPWEARLDTSLSLDKGCYLGQEVVARLNTYDKVQRYLVGLRWEGGSLPAQGSLLMDGEAEVGYVTSAVALPGEPQSIGLGFVKAAALKPGQKLQFSVDNQAFETTVEDRPYWAGKSRRGALLT